MRRILRIVLFVIALPILLVLVLMGWRWTEGVMAERTPQPAFAVDPERGPLEIRLLGNVPSDLRETSGVAVSRDHSGILWSHNDSGDGPIVYALDPAGIIVARYTLEGARAVDWEDMAMGPCPSTVPSASDCLYVGDVGDNNAERGSVTLYVFPEPDPKAGSGGIPRNAILAAELRYPEGPRDTEAIAVTPEGDVWLVTKGREPDIRVYVVPRTALERRRRPVIDLSDAGALPVQPDLRVGRVITGAGFSPSGRRLVVRTYTELYFFHRDEAGVLSSEVTSCFLGDAEPQGEAVAFVDEEEVVVTSEGRGRPGTVYRVRCR